MQHDLFSEERTPDVPVIRLDAKPLSVNECWQGKRFKTKAYKDYEKMLLWLLPNTVEIPKGRLCVEYTFGMSNVQSDWDNPIKPFQDILQKKYLFNDKDIYLGIIRKIKVPIGKEYIKFKIRKYTQQDEAESRRIIEEDNQKAAKTT